jgi:hypothetical protein
MLVARPLGEPWKELRSLSPPLPGWNKKYTRCARLCGQCALSQAAYIRSGWKDRSRCTACRNAVRRRTWGTGPAVRSDSEEQCRIASSARRFAVPASGSHVARMCPFLPACLPAIAGLFRDLPRCPGIRAADIFYLTHALRCWRHVPSETPGIQGNRFTFQNRAAPFCRLP